MKVLVTGVTGFLGGRVAQQLGQAGHQVRGFVRDPAAWSDRPDGAEVEQGDLTDRAAVLRAADGCEAIVHAAALVKNWVKDRRQFEKVNVQGFGHVVDGAKYYDAKLLYVSSFVALGPTDGETFDETTPRATIRFHNDYERTKWVADQMARNLATQGMPIVRLYPGVVYGPGAMTDGNHVVSLLLDHAAGKLPGMLGNGELRQCFAFVDDVADGIVRALDRAQPGSAYILGGENRTAVELFAAFQAATGIAPPKRKIPFAVASLIGKVQRWRAMLFGIPPELTDEVVGIYRHEWAFSSALAQAELGYRVTPLKDGIRQTVEWLRTVGRLDAAPEG